MSKQLSNRLAQVALPGLLAWSAGALALPEVNQEEGWSGFAVVGAGYLNVESNTVAGNNLVDLDNDRLNSNDLNQNASSRSTGVPVLLGEVRWTIGGRNQFFLGTSVENAVTLDAGAQLGWRKTTDDLGTFQVGVLVNNIVPVEVYEDPFLTGNKREKTDSLRNGVRFQWDRIFNSAFEWQLTARSIDVDKDRNGQSLVAGDPSNPADLPDGVDFIDAGELGLLERDADEISTRVSYALRPGEGHTVRPLVGYTRRDADGDAESFDAVRAQLTYAYQNSDVLFTSNILFADREYDDPNPIYDDFRDSKTLAIDATVLVPADFGDGNWSWFANALWGELDSDIDFL